MALLLRRQGITRVRPLAGGFVGWQNSGFPIEDHSPQMPPL
ncbi:MAG: rhodanese-like domain-containing protein [Candidatus Acidiferrales bacterium]